MSSTPIQMKGSPCCAGLMRSCLHTYRTKTNLTQHIIQPWGGGHQPSMGGTSVKYGRGHQPSMGGIINQLWGGISQVWGVISQVWGGHQPTMGGPSAKYGGVINQLWGPSAKYGGGHQPTMGGGHQPSGEGGIFPPVCTGTQNPENYFSNTYVLPSVNRTAGPIM